MSSIISILPETLVHTLSDVDNKALVVKSLPSESYSVFSATKAIGSKIDNATFAAVTVFAIKRTSGNIRLKFTLMHTNTDTVPSTPAKSSDPSYLSYTLAGTTGQVASITLPASLLASFSGMDEGDIVGIGIERDGESVDDTYEADFDIIRIDFEFDKEPAATDYDIITLADAKEYLGIKAGDAGKDDLLRLFINNISISIEQALERKVRVQTIADEIHDGNGSRRLYTRYAPISAFVSGDRTDDVLYRTDPSQAWTKIEATAAYILLNTIEPFYIELYRTYFFSGSQNIKINYKAGYDPIPGDIVMMALEMVQTAYNESKVGNDWLGLQTKSKEGFNLTLALKDLDARWQSTLIKYRRAI